MGDVHTCEMSVTEGRGEEGEAKGRCKVLITTCPTAAIGNNNNNFFFFF
jgi:hypothetical protein